MLSAHDGTLNEAHIRLVMGPQVRAVAFHLTGAGTKHQRAGRAKESVLSLLLA